MLPRLRDQQFGDALMVALARIDAAATGERAGQLQLARQTDAVIGIIGGLGGFLLLAGYAFFHWRRYGRDPYVVDSPSIYLPAPPAELTAAGGALLHDGSSSRRTLTTALLDLASRDELAFRATDRLIGADEVTVEIHPPAVDDPRIRLNRRNPTSPAEDYALDELGDASEAEDGVRVLDKTALLEFGKSVGDLRRAPRGGAGPPRLVHQGAGQGHRPLAPHRRSGGRRGDRGLLGRDDAPVGRLHAPRPRARRRRCLHVHPCRRHAGPHAARRHDEGDAGGLPAHPAVRAGGGPVHGRRGRRAAPGVAGDAGPRRRLVGCPGAPGRGAGGPQAEHGGPAGGAGQLRLSPAVVRVARRRRRRRAAGAAWPRASCRARRSRTSGGCSPPSGPSATRRRPRGAAAASPAARRAAAAGARAAASEAGGRDRVDSPGAGPIAAAAGPCPRPASARLGPWVPSTRWKSSSKS